MTRMPPDVPMRIGPVFSQFTSLTWIELKWNPPANNGAAILKYDVRMTDRGDDPEEEWPHVDEKILKSNTKKYGADGRRTVAKDADALVCRIYDLKSGVPYFFMIRAYNCVGWSAWSEVAMFVTKATKPGKTSLPICNSVGQRDLKFSWEEPEANGAAILRYDLVGGPSQRSIRWAHLAGCLSGTTADATRLFPNEDTETGDKAGGEGFDEIICESLLYTALPAEETSFKLDGLLPGQSYFFMVRGVNSAGKGEFSDIVGPITTQPDKPGEVLPAEVISVTSTTCKMAIQLPYNMGAAISEIAVTLNRTAGPLSEEELDPDTGECYDHIAGRELSLAPSELEALPPEGPGPEDNEWPAGITWALLRCYQDEGV